MKTMRNKSKIAIALFLVLSFAISMFAVLPTVNAAQITRKTGAYITVNPKTVGIGQTLTVNAFILPSPSGPQYEWFDYWFSNLTVTFTRPDGSTDSFMPQEPGLEAGRTEMGSGFIYFYYKPNAVGAWSVKISFPGETYGVYGDMTGDTTFYQSSTSPSFSFVVQEDPVQIGLPPVALPTGYWERPINADNREWNQISGGWLVSGYNYQGSRFNPYSTGPNSGHILWKEPVSPGGIIGGEWGSLSYRDGGGTPPVILNGRVYYNMPTGLVCADLRTGEQIWFVAGASVALAEYERIPQSLQEALTDQVAQYTPDANLWEFGSSQWKRYDAFTGRLIQTLTNLPPRTTSTTGRSGTFRVAWVDYQHVYIVYQTGWNTTKPNRMAVNDLMLWDFSRVTNNNWTTGIVWRTSLKNPDGTGPNDASEQGSSLMISGDVGAIETQNEGELIGYDLRTGTKLYTTKLDFIHMGSRTYDPDTGIWITTDSATSTNVAYDIKTGKKLWVSEPGDSPWEAWVRGPSYAYGNAYIGSYAGRIRAFDVTTGETVWKGDYVGDTTETPFGTWAFYIGNVVADGKVYAATSEHTPTQPRIRGNRLYCFDAYTGKELWNVSGAIAVNAIAEGYLLGASEYDGLLYCFGKGKTETTVAASPKIISDGSNVMLEGSVLDMSPASAGTAAISDADMGTWMDYLHMQKEIPMNAKGVDVSLDAVDPNNNFIHIGTATSDSSGTYGLAFAPEVPGLYKVIATFAGSESYWASYAETFVNVEEAATVTPAEQVVPDNMPIYAAVIGVGIAIIVAIAIAVLLILRKKP